MQRAPLAHHEKVCNVPLVWSLATCHTRWGETIKWGGAKPDEMAVFCSNLMVWFFFFFFSVVHLRHGYENLSFRHRHMEKHTHTQFFIIMDRVREQCKDFYHSYSLKQQPSATRARPTLVSVGAIVKCYTGAHTCIWMGLTNSAKGLDECSSC